MPWSFSESLRETLERGSLLVEGLSRNEAAEWLDAWTEIYGQRGVYDHRWLVFERACPALRRDKALRAYHALVPETAIVLNHRANNRKVSVEGFRVEAPRPFDASGWDLLVFPPSLEWTVAFTHEQGFGPYYSEACWFEDPA